MLKNCPECGALFVSGIKKLCDECSKKDEEDYNKIFKFLRQNPCSKIVEVSEGTGVPRKKIMKFIEEGRISLATIVLDEKEKICCKMCGKEIKSGKLCNVCAEEFKKKLEGTKKVSSQEKKARGERIYIADMIKNKGKI